MVLIASFYMIISFVLGHLMVLIASFYMVINKKLEGKLNIWTEVNDKQVRK